MKVIVLGMDWNEGISKKTGNPYSMASLFCAVPIDGKNAKGCMGMAYDATPEVVRQFDSFVFPFEADLVLQDVMRFGKRETKLLDVKPISTGVKAKV